MPRVIAVIPAYNEAGRIKETLSGLMETGLADSIIVVDDGSSDNTAGVAVEAGAVVIRQKTNTGKGKALNNALNQAEYNPEDIILFIDADVGKTSKEAGKLVKTIADNRSDLAIGLFPPAQRKGGFGIVKTIASAGIEKITGFKAKAPLSGQRAVRAGLLSEILPLETGFGIEVGMTIDVIKKGFRVEEVPVKMTHAETGRSLADFYHRFRQLKDVARVLIKRL